jgi:hypothetical protein
MYIESLRVKNVKLLRDVNLSFQRGSDIRRWTVLVGENGLCKTTLLQAVALAASGQFRANQLAEVMSFPDRRVSDKPAEIEARFTFSREFHEWREYPGLAPKPAEPPILHSKLWIQPGWNVFQGESSLIDAGGQKLTNGTGPSPLDDARARNLHLWFVAGYGTTRTLPIPMSSESPGDPAVSRLNPLFDRGKLVATGFADLLPEPSNGHFVVSLREALVASGLLPMVSGIELRGRGGVRSAESLVQAHRFDWKAGKQPVRVPATWLSQGYQSTIAWIADVIGQVFWEAHGQVAHDKMEGVVLIDELDLHLHPKWQVEFIPKLKETFPNLQFIATTHSPMMLPGLEPDEVIVLNRNEEGNVVTSQLDEAPALMTGSEIYNTFFGLDQLYPTHLGEALQRYGYLIGNPLRTDEEEQEMLQLQQELKDAGLDPGWEPTPRMTPPGSPTEP